MTESYDYDRDAYDRGLAALVPHRVEWPVRVLKKQFQLWATIRSVHDGDTLYGDVDQGIGIVNRGLSTKSGMGLRIYGINTNELEDPGGLECQAYLASLIPIGSEYPIVCLDWDAWAGRIDVSIKHPVVGDLAAHLIREGWALPYFGKGTKPKPAWPRVTP